MFFSNTREGASTLIVVLGVFGGELQCAHSVCVLFMTELTGEYVFEHFEWN